jgi:hypothetical protein
LSSENGLGGWIELCLAMAWRDGTRRFKEKIRNVSVGAWALDNIQERSVIPETIFMGRVRNVVRIHQRHEDAVRDGLSSYVFKVERAMAEGWRVNETSKKRKTRIVSSRPV